MGPSRRWFTTGHRRWAGAGTIILFHITAGPDWANLAYSDLFPQMLRRCIAAGRGESVNDEEAPTHPS
jgi:hypothetical protein